jgi:hypothetical protein
MKPLEGGLLLLREGKETTWYTITPENFAHFVRVWEEGGGSHDGRGFRYYGNAEFLYEELVELTARRLEEMNND